MSYVTSEIIAVLAGLFLIIWVVGSQVAEAIHYRRRHDGKDD